MQFDSRQHIYPFKLDKSIVSRVIDRQNSCDKSEPRSALQVLVSLCSLGADDWVLIKVTLKLVKACQKITKTLLL